MAVNLNLPRPEDLYPVRGVKLGVAEAGIRKAGRKDLLLVTLAEGTRVAGVFTQNRFCAAPVQVAKEHLASGKPARALLVNTGNANAGTGSDGIARARASCGEAARLLGCDTRQVLPFSTGVIMEPLPVECIAAGLPACLASLREDNWAQAAEAITTTDTVPKARSARVLIGDGAAGGSAIDGVRNRQFEVLKEAVVEVSQQLAQAIVRDGEGATKFITVRVEKGRNESECGRVAYAI